MQMSDDNMSWRDVKKGGSWLSERMWSVFSSQGFRDHTLGSVVCRGPVRHFGEKCCSSLSKIMTSAAIDVARTRGSRIIVSRS